MTGPINHIEIYVSNLSRSLEFWGWLLTQLGYKEYQTWNEGKSYIFRKTYIVFVQTDSKYLDIPYHRRRVGLNHLAFQLSSKRQLREFSERLKAKKISMLYQDKDIGKNNDAIYFEDPDRIKVELVVSK